MDFNKFSKGLIITSFTFILFTSCTDYKKDKSNTDNTFYIELINFTHDSLKETLTKNIFGKASYYQNNKLQILSVNYLTDNLPEMHYFINAEVLKKDIQTNTKKIKIEFKGTYSLDSINYSLQKFNYNNKKWIKISDMGFIKGYSTLTRPENIMKEFVDQIIKNTIEYSYN
jgi:hypothetical protein